MGLVIGKQPQIYGKGANGIDKRLKKKIYREG